AGAPEPAGGRTWAVGGALGTPCEPRDAGSAATVPAVAVPAAWAGNLTCAGGVDGARGSEPPGRRRPASPRSWLAAGRGHPGTGPPAASAGKPQPGGGDGPACPGGPRGRPARMMRPHLAKNDGCHLCGLRFQPGS
ncbi:PREDICTED: galectin-3-like, partial [Chinchilla lanigera]|uniref:galectin-3-like n=1 Tax=Chinchilla lanigera TaxID=34839 RepID=UPI000695F626